MSILWDGHTEQVRDELRAVDRREGELLRDLLELIDYRHALLETLRVRMARRARDIEETRGDE